MGNALGTDKTKGSLTVNKMTQQEKEDYEKLKANGLQAVVQDEEKKVVKKEQEKKTYDWKKGVKKVEKKPVEEAKAPEKVQLKKPKPVEKQKEESKEGIKLKPIPGKEKPQPEKAEPVKLKPVPPKEKKEEATQQVSMIDKKVSKKINSDQPTTQAESKLPQAENIQESNEEIKTEQIDVSGQAGEKVVKEGKKSAESKKVREDEIKPSTKTTDEVKQTEDA